MGKRANGDGSISKRNDGRWCARLSIGRDEFGKLKRLTVYGKTEQAVADQLRVLRLQYGRKKENLTEYQSSDQKRIQELENEVANLKQRLDQIEKVLFVEVMELTHGNNIGMP
jgi:uncharacterized protein YceH (UPF0502 family)